MPSTDSNTSKKTYLPVQKISETLIFLLAISAPIGQGMNFSTNFDASKLFVGFSISIILWSGLVGRLNFRTIPKQIILLISFILVHILISNIFTQENILGFGYTNVSILEFEGKSRSFSSEETGTKFGRIVLFAIFAVALSGLIRTPKTMINFVIGYNLGIILIILIGGYSNPLNLAIDQPRFSGGVFNPNSWARIAVVGFYLSMIAINLGNWNWYRKIIFLPFIILSTVTLVETGSRGGIAAFLFGLSVFLIFIPGLNRKILLIGGIALVILSSSILVSDIYLTSTLQRISPSEISDSRTGSRLDIWTDYVKNSPNYYLFGTGFGNATEAIKGTKSWPKGPHNGFLSIFVQFGFIGLLIWVSVFFYLLNRLRLIKQTLRWNSSDAAMMSLVVTLIVSGLTMEIISDRTSWIVIALASSYIKWRNVHQLSISANK